MIYAHNESLLPVTDVIPHRPPHLWLDGVTECVPGESAAGFWTPGEEHFMGHFNEEMQLLQGVKQLESVGQLGAYAIMSEAPGETMPLFGGAEDVEFLAPVFPGDILSLTVEDFKRDKRKFTGFARVAVGEDVACEATITGLVLPKDFAIKMIARARADRQS
jgi:3-hydroxyacyl-[acyl-carrier-protein] dehydratase